MAGRMIWHDRRLQGAPPARAPHIYIVDQNDDLNDSITWIANYAGSKNGLDELSIMCHGYEAIWAAGKSASIATPIGGFGLQLCRQGLNLGNIGKTMAWKRGGPLIRRIKIFACSTAQLGPGNAGVFGDAKRFMGELALHSGAAVIAGRDAQAYVSDVRVNNPVPINFGDWEGPVFLFDPQDGTGKPHHARAMV